MTCFIWIVYQKSVSDDSAEIYSKCTIIVKMFKVNCGLPHEMYCILFGYESYCILSGYEMYCLLDKKYICALFVHGIYCTLYGYEMDCVINQKQV